MTIEPLRNLPVVRDLTVERGPYEKRFLELEPWIERGAPYPGFPEPLTHREMKFASRALDCVSCAACYSACPVVGLGDVTKFSGPAPLVQIAQAALDPRDSRDRAADLIERASIFSCVSCYRCEEVCPAGIPIVSRVIEPLKALAYRTARKKPRHPRVFLDVIRRRGPHRPFGAGVTDPRPARPRPPAPRGRSSDPKKGEPVGHGVRQTHSRHRSTYDAVPENLMKLAYFPGCSAQSTCKELNASTHLVARTLGLELRRIPLGDVHRQPRDPRGATGALPCPQCAHPRDGGARRPAADDDLQYLHAQLPRRDPDARRGPRSPGPGERGARRGRPALRGPRGGEALPVGAARRHR